MSVNGSSGPSVGEVKRIYDKAYAHPGLMGTHFDEEYSRVTKEALLADFDAAPSADLLDLGMGDGDLWTYAPGPARGYGLDISETGVRRAVARFPEVRGTVGVLERLPYADASFGMVVAADTMEHAFDPLGAFAEVRRVLRPGGVFAFSVPTPDSLRKWGYNRIVLERPSPRMLLALTTVVAKRALLFGRPDFQPIDLDLDVQSWRDMATGAGFRVLEARAWPAPPYRALTWLIRARALSGAPEDDGG